MNQLDSAQSAYAEAERRCKEQPGTDAVLVSVDSLAALRRAYPNYFADTTAFVNLLKSFLASRQKAVTRAAG